jgi:hypothetical protein
MKPKRYSLGFALLALLVFLLPADSAGQQSRSRRVGETATSRNETGPVKSSTGETFYVAPTPESSAKYNVVISDGDERVISGTFSVKELQVIASIMKEAREFAFTEEGVGRGEPITTRFSSDEVEGFAIDVSKFEGQTHLFINLNTELGFITADGGLLTRAPKKEEGFFFDILARLENQLTRLPKQGR